MLWKFGAGQRLPNSVIADVSNLSKPIEQAECLKDARIDAYADIGVASFNPLKG